MSGSLGASAPAARPGRSGVFFGAVALVLEGVGLKTCSPPMPQRQKKLKVENSLLTVMWEWGWGARELGSWEPGGEQGSWGAGRWGAGSWGGGSWGAGELVSRKLVSWGAGRWGAGELGAGELEAGERGTKEEVTRSWLGELSRI